MEHVPRQQYTKEFREQAVQLVLEQQLTIPEAASVPLTISWTRLLPYSPRARGRIVRRSSLLGQLCASFFESHFTRRPHSSTIDLVMRPSAGPDGPGLASGTHAAR